MPLRQKGGRISISLTVHQREELVTATTQEQCVREWKHYQVILLLDQGRTPAEAVAALGCGLASVYNWARAWRRNGLAGLREKARGRILCLYNSDFIVHSVASLDQAKFGFLQAIRVGKEMWDGS